LSDPGKKQLLSIAFCLGEVITNGFDHRKIYKTGYAEIYGWLPYEKNTGQDLKVAYVVFGF
jgi:hypothetical protein